MSLGLSLFGHYLSSAKGLRKDRMLNCRKSVPKHEEQESVRKCLAFDRCSCFCRETLRPFLPFFFFFNLSLFNAVEDFS